MCGCGISVVWFNRARRDEMANDSNLRVSHVDSGTLGNISDWERGFQVSHSGSCDSGAAKV